VCGGGEREGWGAVTRYSGGHITVTTRHGVTRNHGQESSSLLSSSWVPSDSVRDSRERGRVEEG